MNVTHICLTGPFTDNWNYQENLLSKYHKKAGNNVSIITSKWMWGEDGNLKKDNRNTFFNSDGIKVIRINLKGKDSFNKKIKRYYNFYNDLKNTKPDIIFVHGCQFIDIKKIAKYAKKNPETKIFVDNHADYSNSATNWISRVILHKFIWRKCAQLIEPYTSRFYGVLPARVDFLINVYKVPSKKVELLMMGADDDIVERTKDLNAKMQLREEYGIKRDEFLIVTGGKIDKEKKQIILLMKAVRSISNKHIKLLVFGSVISELKETINELADGEKVQYIGWVESSESYKIFAASDLVVFPGRHSIFWEQVVGQGIPMIVKYWEGTSHINLGGNVKFLKEDTEEEIKSTILKIVDYPLVYNEMKKIAMEKGMVNFSYKEIAKRSIQ